jgi:hypothetical protein
LAITVGSIVDKLQPTKAAQAASRRNNGIERNIATSVSRKRV